MIRRTLLLAAVCCLLAPAAAQAADTTITFDGLAAGTVLDDQYEADGILFGDASAFGFAPDANCTPSAPGVVAVPGVFGASAPNAARLGLCGGSPEFPQFASMGAFSTFRSRMSVRVASTNGITPGGDAVVLKVYDVRRHLLATTAPVLQVAGPAQTLSIDLVTPQIAFFVVQRLGTSGVPVAMDDVTFDNPPVPPNPQIAIGVDTQGFAARLMQGGTKVVTVRILRFNGSNGNVALTAGDLPAGVISSIFAPNPAGGSKFLTTSKLTLTASPFASTGRSAPTIQAAPVASAGSQSDATTFDLDIVPPFTLTGEASATVTPCTPTSALMNLNVEPGYTEPIHLTVAASSPTIAASLPSTFVPGFTAPITSLPLSAPLGVGKGGGSLTITAESGFYSKVHSVTVTRSGGSISAVKLAAVADIYPTSVRAPQLGIGGTFLHLLGSGFCPNSSIRFGKGDEVGAPVEDRSPDGRSAYVRVPPTATSGAPVLINNDSDGTSADTVSANVALSVDSYRRTRGFQFANFPSSGPSWDDVVGLYGRSETNIQVDPCEALSFGIFNCSLGSTFIPEPQALLYWNHISDYGENGNCYGVILASYRLTDRRKALSEFPPAGAESPWSLDGFKDPAPALRSYVRQMMIVQSSRNALEIRAANVGRQNATTFREAIERINAAGRPALVSLRKDDDTGHAVLAYDVVPTPGGYDVLLYDPNTPYLDAETTNASGHTSRLAQSRIHVTGSRWSFLTKPGGGASDTWSNGFDRIGAYDPGRLPDKLSLPDSIGDALLTIMNPDALTLETPTAGGRPLPGVVPFPAESGDGTGPLIKTLPRGRALEAGLSGKRGSIAVFAGSRGFELTGAAQGVTIDRGAQVLGVRGAGDGFKLSATTNAGAGSRVATAVFRHGGRGAYALGFSGGALTVRSASGGAADLTLGQVSRSGVGSLKLTGLRLRPGDRATVRPSSWIRPGSVNVSITGRAGARRLRLTARRVRAAVAVSSLRLNTAAARGGAKVTARARVRLRGVPAAGGTLVWQLARGGRVVRKGTLPVSRARLVAGRALTFTARAPSGTYALRVALVVGGAPSSSLLPSVGSRQARATVRIR